MTDHPASPSAPRRRVIAVGVAALLGVSLTTAAVPRASHADDSSMALTSPRVPAPLPAVTRPARDVSLAAPFDGRLASIWVEEGDIVERGDTLASMDDRVARAAVALAEADARKVAAIDRAVTDRDLAARDLERLQASAASGAATESELDRARNRFDAAEAALAAAHETREIAQRRLALEQARLEEHHVRAPFAGIVVRIDSEAGAALNLADPIVRMVSLETLKADLHLPASLYGGLAVGEEVRLLANEPLALECEGSVLSIEPLIDAGSRTFRCRVEIANPGGGLPAGFVVRLKADAYEAIAKTAEAERQRHRARLIVDVPVR